MYKYVFFNYLSQMMQHSRPFSQQPFWREVVASTAAFPMTFEVNNYSHAVKRNNKKYRLHISVPMCCGTKKLHVDILTRSKT